MFAKNNIEKNVKERVLFKRYKEHFECSLHLWTKPWLAVEIKINHQPEILNSNSYNLFRKSVVTKISIL